ncbi:MAG: hypothetical protein RLY16_915 [Bacteroidota bacterium]|jgi:hypothetical protein
MSNSLAIDAGTIEQWLVAKREPKAIEAELSDLGHDADSVAAHLKEFKRLKNAKRQFTGFILMAVGAFLGFISCVLSITNPIPGLFNVILYGLTMVAILIIVLGLYYVVE